MDIKTVIIMLSALLETNSVSKLAEKLHFIIRDIIVWYNNPDISKGHEIVTVYDDSEKFTSVMQLILSDDREYEDGIRSIIYNEICVLKELDNFVKFLNSQSQIINKIYLHNCIRDKRIKEDIRLEISGYIESFITNIKEHAYNRKDGGIFDVYVNNSLIKKIYDCLRDNTEDISYIFDDLRDYTFDFKSVLNFDLLRISSRLIDDANSFLPYYD